MAKEKGSNINIKGVKGNVVISQNQSGGITAHQHDEIPPQPEKKALYKKILYWIGAVSAILTILTYLGIQLKSKEDKKPITKISHIIPKLDSVIPPVKSLTLYDSVKHKKHHLRKKIMENKENDTNKKSPSVGDVKGDVVISQNQSGGITAHTVNVNQPKQLNSNDIIALFNFIETVKQKDNFNPTCFSITMVNNSNGNTIASQIEQVLKQRGYTMNGTSYGYMMRYPDVKGISIGKEAHSNCLQILIGQF